MSENESLFKGSIGRTYRDSQPWWPDELPAPKGAPNIVIIVLDDVGWPGHEARACLPIA
jgi:hypothetical protein